ncbi:hypothetical protein Tco_0359405 [Tanacetum coccineum]
MEGTLSKFMAESAKRHEEHSSLIKEIRASTDVAIRNQGASIKALEIQIKDEQGTSRKGIWSRANIPFPSRLKEYGYDEKEVLREFEKLQVSLTESASSLKKLLRERWRIEEEIKAKMNEHYSVIVKDALPLSEDSDFGDFIELNDLNEPLELRNHEIEGLGPTIKEGEVTDKLKVDIIQTRDDDIIVENIDEYLSFCDYDRKIKDNYAYNLPFSCMIDFAVVENIDAYRDKDMGDIFFGKPFCKSAYVEARRFDGFITISDGNDSVTYQMARSHPRFKHLSNEQCNKIRPLRDKLKGKSHPYQMLKDFYNRVLDLGPKYIRDKNIFEWLTRGHVSMHKMD